jgi:predicted transcriptional regulator
LSIKPEFAKSIFDGNKKYEYRKATFKRSPINKILIYVTSPICMIMGEFEIEEILSDDPHTLWSKTSSFAGISKDFFLDYFEGRDKGYAIHIRDIRMYPTPINPWEAIEDFTPPQNFQYLSKDISAR